MPARGDSKFLYIFPAAAVVILVVMVIAILPSSQGQPTCNVVVTLSGTYVDLGFTQFISNFQMNALETSCGSGNVLSNFLNGFSKSPLAQNIFATSVNFAITMQGPQNYGNNLQVGIPPLQTAYGFTASSQFSGVAKGTYTITVIAPIQISLTNFLIGAAPKQSMTFTVV